MARGITIAITRRIERRDRRKGEIRLGIWTGRKWVGVDSLPLSPGLAWIYGSEPQVSTTRIEFLPPDVVPYTTLLYQKTLLPRMRALGVIQ